MTVKTPPTPITSPYAPDLGAMRAWLEKMIAGLRFMEIVTAVVTLVGRMCAINAELTNQLVQLRTGRPRSETLRRIEAQLVLPLEGIAIVAVPPKTAESNDENERKKKTRKGRHPGRGALPAHLPRVEVINSVPADGRVCPVCGAAMKTVGHSRCEILNVIPAQVVVEVRLDERVACPNDDTIVSAATPPAIVERGKLGDTLIIEALVDKFLEHTPLERQCARFAAHGVHVAPQTLGRSVSAAIELLTPVAKLIESETRGPGLLATDATGIPVLDPDAQGGIRTGTIWCWTNARWVTFYFARAGDSQSVRDFLGEDLARTVQCDGTSVTSFLERTGGKRPGCWSHGRRRLAEAARSGDQIALEGLRIIARIFTVERLSTVNGDTADERRARRQEHTRPVLDELRAWLDVQRGAVPPKTPLGRALGYLHRQWHRLILFLDDGNIEATNNRRERELRRLVQGRKNWLFTWLDDGGQRTAHILTIVATCIAHEVNPRAYLHVVSKAIVDGWPQARLRELLPDRIVAAHPELYVGESVDVPALASSVTASSTSAD